MRLEIMLVDANAQTFAYWLQNKLTSKVSPVWLVHLSETETFVSDNVYFIEPGENIFGFNIQMNGHIEEYGAKVSSVIFARNLRSTREVKQVLVCNIAQIGNGRTQVIFECVGYLRSHLKMLENEIRACFTVHDNDKLKLNDLIVQNRDQINLGEKLGLENISEFTSPFNLSTLPGFCSGYPLTPSPDEYFVAHEFSEEKLGDLRSALKQGLSTTNLQPYTTDQDIRPGHRLCKIAAKILTTAFCVFDLPETQDRNVYLELGIAIGLGRPFILIKNENAEVPTLVQGLDHFGFSSYTGLRREMGDRVQVGQFSTILSPDDVPIMDTYFLSDGEFEQDDFRESVGNSLAEYGLIPVYLTESQVGSQLALTQLIHDIKSARFGIYRIDEKGSSNAFLALGIAIGLNKPWLLVARQGETIPVDVRGLANFAFHSFGNLENEFARRCENFLSRYAVNNIVSVFKGSPIKRINEYDSGDSSQVKDNRTNILTNKQFNWEKQMSGIPSHLYNLLRETLADCEQFESNRSVRDLFADQNIKLWRNGLPEADGVVKRVEALISYLHDKYHRDGTNALVALLYVLIEKFSPDDNRYIQLNSLAKELGQILRKNDLPSPQSFTSHKVNQETLTQSNVETDFKAQKPSQSSQLPKEKQKQDSHIKEISASEKKDFFISYNRHDKQWAEWIAWQLEEEGYTTIIQAWDFRPGGNFVNDMQKATMNAERTIAVLSTDYLEAQFTKPEWNAAFAQDPTGEKGLLLPVRVRECELKGLLPQIVYIDLINLDPNMAQRALLDGVKRGRVKPETPPNFPGAKLQSNNEPTSFPG